MVTWLATERRPHPIYAGLSAIIITLCLIAAVPSCTGTLAAPVESLYRAQTTVTGQGEANRIIGFGLCLEDVLIKISGAMQLASDPRLADYKQEAAGFVSAHSYHDQMSGTPTRDEQGTRDRPYDLIVDFDEKKIDGLLNAVGLKPWLSHRPVLGLFVEMQQETKKYIVTADAKQSDLQRDSVLAAAAKRGMTVVLPSVAQLAKSNIKDVELERVPSVMLSSVTAEQGGEISLVGRLVWSDQELGWATEWQMHWQGRPHRWQSRGTTFDEAFRRGIGGAARILSGNGDPG